MYECSKAAEAFASWSALPSPVRGRLLSTIADDMTVWHDELVEVVMEETGKTKEQAEGEVRSAIDMCVFMAGEGRRMYGDTTSSELPHRWAMTKRYPIGVVGIIVPWNFPLSLMAWKVFPALICGNTVVLKASYQTPKTADLFTKIIQCVLPDNVFNLVYDGKKLVGNENIKMISFTGSTTVGREIAEICGRRLIKCSLELGGKNAAIVLEDADLELAARCVADGAFSFGGQRCASTSRCIVHKGVWYDFVAALKAETKRYKGAKLELCYSSDSSMPEFWNKELFKPSLIVLQVESFERAIEFHNYSSYGLTGAVFTKDINKALKAVDLMQCGVCYVNAPTFGSEVHLPFGGMKQSGNGCREVGKAAIEAFSELKTIYIDYSGVSQNAQTRKK